VGSSSDLIADQPQKIIALCSIEFRKYNIQSSKFFFLLGVSSLVERRSLSTNE
jgi:hypothetical protein